MKPAMVIASITGGLVLAGAAAVGSVYLFAHRPPHAAQTIAQTAPPAPAAPAVADATPPPSRAMTRRLGRHARVCAVPVAYHHRSRPIVRPIIRTRLHILPPAYGSALVYGPPPPRGWYGRPYWRAGWRGPRFDGPERFAYQRGPYERGPWSGW